MNAEMLNEDRLIDLETRLAYQEATLQDLNAVVTDQQLRIAELETLCRQLIDRVARLGQDVHKGTAADEVPPHY
ncbi:SlyX family protein [Solimonas soli]|uniref:SlyX family protein n=1 Tax=Solimonas soli TaxID=413479 RepID=UPI001B7FB6F0|nr:SlyX family protein [Solimonas soli]